MNNPTTTETRWMVMDSEGWAVKSYSTKRSAQRRAKQIGGSVKDRNIQGGIAPEDMGLSKSCHLPSEATKLTIEQDELTRKLSAFGSFNELVNGTHPSYRPSLTQQDTDTQRLADLYDLAQAAKGDDRRAFRGVRHVVLEDCQTIEDEIGPEAYHRQAQEEQAAIEADSVLAEVGPASDFSQAGSDRRQGNPPGPGYCWDNRKADRRKDGAARERLDGIKGLLSRGVWEDLILALRSTGGPLTDQAVDGMSKAMAGEELTLDDLAL